MRLINCEVKLNEYHQKGIREVTPAEVVVLRKLHDVAAGGCCIKNPVAAGEKKCTAAEEIQRLMGKYKARGSAPNSHLVTELFPGVNPELPETFDHPHVGLKVAKPGQRIQIEEDGEAESQILQLRADVDRLMASKGADSEVISDLKEQNASLQQQLDQLHRQNEILKRRSEPATGTGTAAAEETPAATTQPTAKPKRVRTPKAPPKPPKAATE